MTKASQDFLDSLVNEFEHHKNPSIGKKVHGDKGARDKGLRKLARFEND